jgi:hypothetical protein
MAEVVSNAGHRRRTFVTEGIVEKHVRSILAKLDLPESGTEHRRGAGSLAAARCPLARWCVWGGTPVLWTALPIAIVVAAYAPGVLPFACCLATGWRSRRSAASWPQFIERHRDGLSPPDPAVITVGAEAMDKIFASEH